jgi:hypothetical protein
MLFGYRKLSCCSKNTPQPEIEKERTVPSRTSSYLTVFRKCYIQHRENIRMIAGSVDPLASASSALRSSTFWQISHQEKLPNSCKKCNRIPDRYSNIYFKKKCYIINCTDRTK